MEFIAIVCAIVPGVRKRYNHYSWISILHLHRRRWNEWSPWYLVLVCLFSVHWDIATSYSLSWGVSARELCFLTHRIPVVVLFFLYSNCPILSLLEWLVEGRFWLILVFWLFTGTSCGVCFSSPLPFFLLVPLRFLLAIGYYVHSPDCRSLTWSCWYVTS